MNRHFPSYSLALALVLVSLLATGLRFYRIDAQSFWNDEGNSARLAERSINLIVEGSKGDIHPPGYYLILHFWRALFGQSETALRGLSAVASVLLVGFTFLVGRRLYQNLAAAVGAAFLVAINPFQVYYGQEARMYALLALWAMASTWALLAWFQSGGRESPPPRLPLGVYAVFAAAGLYTHYAFPFVMLVHNLIVGAWLWTTRQHASAKPRAVAWVLTQVAVAALFLPWLPTAWHQVTSWSPPQEAHRWPRVVADVWRLFHFGQTIPTLAVPGGLIAAALEVAMGLMVPLRLDGGSQGTDALGRHRLPYHQRWSLLALLVLVPTGLILGLGLYREAYQKFLLTGAAPLSLLVAGGVVRGWGCGAGPRFRRERVVRFGLRALTTVCAIVFLYDTGRSLHNLYFDVSYARDDYRAIARHIEQSARPGDAVILNAPNQWEVFTYYYPDDEDVFPLARQRPLDVAVNRAELERILAGHDRLFAVYWGDAESDPERFIEGWLEQHAYKAGETWYGNVRLALYAAPAQMSETPEEMLDIRFDGRGGEPTVFLDGFSVLNDPLAPGEILQLALFWHVEAPIAERYKVFVHLYDPAGNLVTQTDSEPGGALRPTNTWEPGEVVVDRYGVPLPSTVSPGDYTLAVGLYLLTDPDSRLQVTQDGVWRGDRFDLTGIRVLDLE